MHRDFIFIHSAGNQDGQNGSKPFLGRLETALARQFKMIAPDMPDPELPDCTKWLDEIGQALSDLRPGSILLGHSLGGSTILQYLARNPQILGENSSLSAAFIVAAPFWGLEDWEISDFSLSDAEVMTLQDQKSLFFCQSRDDLIVPFAHLDIYAGHFPGATIIALEDAGHSMADGDIDALLEKINLM
ncbi:alpha/beta hydrolase [Thalassospira sp.]|uniref:alpha/beta hydrolase n=1 Tax=Thalassospira sp. TaxID=1912094 RepID=UPI0032ECD4CE